MEEGSEGLRVTANESAVPTEDMATTLSETSAEPKTGIIGKLLGLFGGKKQEQASPSARGPEMAMGQGPAITPTPTQEDGVFQTAPQPPEMTPTPADTAETGTPAADETAPTSISDIGAATPDSSASPSSPTGDEKAA